MSEFYLVKDGERTVTLAAERDGKLYAFVPNVGSFVYNKPMSVDFQIDHEMNYESVDAETAANIVREGSVGKIDEQENEFLLDHMMAETRRINPREVLSAEASPEPEPTPAQVAIAVAALLRKMPLGQWIPYKVYPRDLLRQARRRASDLSMGRVQAFSDIPLISRVISSTDNEQIVEVSRTSAARKGRAAPRRTAKKAAEATGVKASAKSVRGKAAAAAKAGTRASAKSH